MQQLLKSIEDKQKKTRIVDVNSGDVVRVHQRIKEGSKTRTQVFEGLVIRLDRLNSLSARITVRRISSGVGVEKSFLLHSPLVERVEVIKRSHVRRNYLTYMRKRSGKSTRLAGVDFDRASVNVPSIDEQRAKALAELSPEESAAEVTKATNEEAVKTADDKTEVVDDNPNKSDEPGETNPKSDSEQAPTAQ